MTASNADRHTWALDREIVLSRVFEAPRALVFKAWTDAEQACRWFGPKGFTCKNLSSDLRVGGHWRFEMRAPDGTVYSNRMKYLEILPNERLVYEHGSDVDDDPNRFHVTITFDEQADKKTVVTLRQLHPTKARREAVIGFGAVELGYQTLEKCAEHLRAQR
ncbi:MAG: SRPBCC family protein [Myxococcaceae bacterium]|nr:SRPBCC family protein [Myxococcaceae bacterium]